MDYTIMEKNIPESSLSNIIPQKRYIVTKEDSDIYVNKVNLTALNWNGNISIKYKEYNDKLTWIVQPLFNTENNNKHINIINSTEEDLHCGFGFHFVNLEEMTTFTHDLLSIKRI